MNNGKGHLKTLIQSIHLVHYLIGTQSIQKGRTLTPCKMNDMLLFFQKGGHIFDQLPIIMQNTVQMQLSIFFVLVDELLDCWQSQLGNFLHKALTIDSSIEEDEILQQINPVLPAL